MNFFINNIFERPNSYKSCSLMYDEHDINAATSILEGHNPRDLRAAEDPTSKYLLTMYVPLACHTQGVESAVKEAKLVSPTGRHEPLRSAYAIVRSHLVLSTDGALASTKSAERASLLLEAAT